MLSNYIANSLRSWSWLPLVCGTEYWLSYYNVRVSPAVTVTTATSASGLVPELTNAVSILFHVHISFCLSVKTLVIWIDAREEGMFVIVYNRNKNWFSWQSFLWIFPLGEITRRPTFRTLIMSYSHAPSISTQWLNNPQNIWWRVQVMKPHIT